MVTTYQKKHDHVSRINLQLICPPEMANCIIVIIIFFFLGWRIVVEFAEFVI